LPRGLSAAPRVATAQAPDDLSPINWDFKKRLGGDEEVIANATLSVKMAAWPASKPIHRPQRLQAHRPTLLP